MHAKAREQAIRHYTEEQAPSYDAEERIGEEEDDHLGGKRQVAPQALSAPHQQHYIVAAETRDAAAKVSTTAITTDADIAVATATTASTIAIVTVSTAATAAAAAG
jgi:hypothetical protein